MTYTLYNPFMPDLRYKGRMVFGGGGGGGGNRAAQDEAVTGTGITGTAGPTNSSLLSQFKSSLNQAKTSVSGAGLDTIAHTQQMISAVNAVPMPTFSGEDAADFTTKAQDAKSKTLTPLNDLLTKAQNRRNAEMATEQRDLTAKAVSDPGSVVEKADVTSIDPTAEGTTIAADTGKVDGTETYSASTVDKTETAATPDDITAATYSADKVTEDAKKALEGVSAAQGDAEQYKDMIEAAQGMLSEGAFADAAKFNPEFLKEVFAGQRTVSAEELAQAQGLDEEAVKAQIAQTGTPENIQVAQTSVKPNEIPEPAQIAESDMAQAESITSAGLTEDATATAAKLAKFSVDDQTLAEFKEGKIEAQDTVQGQLEKLMKDFDDGTPAWAAGAMRAANAAMASRGLGASSMASAAIVQAAMETALPIASADAAAFRQMKLDNLNRQQQVSLANAAAQQGVELANFNAEQQTALQNSQNAFALQSQNLSNMQQAMIASAQIKASLQGQNLSNRQQSNMAEASRYAEVNNINLSNRQQGLLQDSSNNLQVDLANLSSKQQSYVVSAQLEAALQGKQIDNRQQTAILNAAKYSEAANITFTAEQQAQLHNSELMKTIGLAELNSEQASILQNAAQVASMDMANLNNRQQAAVENAKNFLQMDLANLSNRQQTTLFKAQAVQQALLSDQAAENAAKQFNAASENQTNQFMASLKTQVDQFNAGQKNAINQFNAGQENAEKQFNAGQENATAKFNASNSLVIAQSNATWRQNAETINTAAENQANMDYAKEKNGLTTSALDNMWQRERDMMDFKNESSENAKDRALNTLLADKNMELFNEKLKAEEDAAETEFWIDLADKALEWD